MYSGFDQKSLCLALRIWIVSSGGIVGIGRATITRDEVETRGFRPGWGSVARPMFAASTAGDGSKV